MMQTGVWEEGRQSRARAGQFKGGMRGGWVWLSSGSEEGLTWPEIDILTTSLWLQYGEQTRGGGEWRREHQSGGHSAAQAAGGGWHRPGTAAGTKDPDYRNQVEETRKAVPESTFRFGVLKLKNRGRIRGLQPGWGLRARDTDLSAQRNKWNQQMELVSCKHNRKMRERSLGSPQWKVSRSKRGLK